MLFHIRDFQYPRFVADQELALTVQGWKLIIGIFVVYFNSNTKGPSFEALNWRGHREILLVGDIQQHMIRKGINGCILDARRT